MSNVTQILSQIEKGDPNAAEQLLPLVYEELRKLAAARLVNEKPGQTLQATALVHDAYTRSDIYSLGVLLYDLFTGETPFDKQRLRSAAFDELLRIIREEEPPRPSTRLSASQTLPSIAANRHTEPRKLGTLVRGELDWIVMKALEKDRSRRYESCGALSRSRPTRDYVTLNRQIQVSQVRARTPRRVEVLKSEVFSANMLIIAS